MDDNTLYRGGNESTATNMISVANMKFNVTADTTVLRVDSDADKDEDIGQAFTYGSTTMTKAQKKTDGTYTYNVFFVLDEKAQAQGEDDLDIAVLVIDSTGAFKGYKVGDTNDDNDDDYIDNDIEGLTKSLNKDGDKLTIAFTVPEGTTALSVDYEVKVDGIINVSGTAKESGGDADITVVGTQAKFTVDLDPTAESVDAVSLTLKNLVYSGFQGASASDINDALKQENASVTVTGNIAANAVINVPADAELDMTGATVAEGAKVVIAEGATVTLPNGETIDSSTMEADCTLTLIATNGGVTFYIPARGTLTLKGNAKLGAKDAVVLEDGAKLVGSSNSVTLTVATVNSVSGGINNFYQNDGTTSEEKVQAKTYTWTTDKWVANL